MATVEVEKVKLQISTGFQEIFTQAEVDQAELSKWKKLEIVRDCFQTSIPASRMINRKISLTEIGIRLLLKLYPGSMISHRTALEGKRPEEQGIYLMAFFTKHVDLPGLTLHFGHPSVKDDYIYCENVFVSQVARAYLENIQTIKVQIKIDACQLKMLINGLT